jgi:hypothetical protein
MQGGFSLYNRGDNLKESLINPDRVKAYLTNPDQLLGCKTTKAGQKPVKVPKLELSHKAGELNKDLEWKLMMDYLRDNPEALMEAIPTPEGELEDALGDFHTGLTPKHGSFKFGGDMGQNRPPQLPGGKFYPFNRQPSAKSVRSSTSSNHGTPSKQF